MAFLGPVLGGLASGAGSAAVGGLFSMFGGGGGQSTPTYTPSPLMQALDEYAQAQLQPSKQSLKTLVKEAKTYGDPGSREAFLQSYIDKVAGKPKRLEKQLRKSYKKPIDWEGGGYRDIATQAYGEQGLSMGGEDFQNLINIAKAKNIRGTGAFGDEVRRSLIASRKVKTPADIAWEKYAGPMPRNPETGELMPGLIKADPARMKLMADALIG